MVLDGKVSQECPVNAGVPEDFILFLTFFLLYITDLPGDVIWNTAIYANDNIFLPKPTIYVHN